MADSHELDRPVMRVHGRPSREAVDWVEGDHPQWPYEGWRRLHALQSIRACIGTLAFAALAVRGGEQLMGHLAKDPAEREREWDRAQRWSEQLKRQGCL